MPALLARTARPVPSAPLPGSGPARTSARRLAGLPVPRRSAAFTIVEVAFGLAIAGVVLGIGAPAFHHWLESRQLANHAEHLAETLMRARTEAVRRGHRVSLCKSSDGTRCDAAATWQRGFIVYGDANNSGQIDPDEPLIEVDGPAPAGITVTANHPLEHYVSYTSLGHARMLNGALQMGTLTLCRRGHRVLHVVLASGGRARIERTQDVCP